MNIFSAGIASAIFATSLLASAPAAAINTTTLYTPDYAAKAIVYWYWEGSYKRTTGFHIYDTKCDGHMPILKFFLGTSTISKVNDYGCNTDRWYNSQILFAKLQLCNDLVCDIRR